MTTYFADVASEAGLNPIVDNPCRLIDFARLVLGDGAIYEGHTGEREVLLVLFGGRCTVDAGGTMFTNIGQRANPFTGRPHAVYLPHHTAYIVRARGNLVVRQSSIEG